MSDYPTPIGTMKLETNWPALELAVRKRCGWPTPPAREFSVSAMQVVEMPALPAGALQVYDAQVRGTETGIEIILPEHAYLAGALLDWLWLAIPQACAPADTRYLHAAAVERDGEVLLIGGPSGSGKTTALLAYLDAGWRFVADDAVIIDGAGQVVPWGCDLHLSPEVVAERWPDRLPGWLDHNAKCRFDPQALGYATSAGGRLTRTILLADEGEDVDLRHVGLLLPAPDAPGDDTFLAQFGPVAKIGRRPAELTARALRESSPACPALAVITLFAGKDEALDRWIEAFLQFGIPAEAHLLWLNNSENDDFDGMLRERLALLASRYPHIHIWRDAHHIGHKDRQVSYLYQQARTRIPAECEAVLTLEDDVLPEAGAFAKMLREYGRHPGCDVVGLPVPHNYRHGGVASPLVWNFYQTPHGNQVGERLWAREVEPQHKPGEVGALSFSCTLMPRALFDKASLAPGGDNYVADGYDLRFCREVREQGARIVALWGTEAVHLAGRELARVTLAKRLLLVVGEGAEIPDGPTWEVFSRQTWADALDSREGDYLLLAGRDVSMSPAYLGALVAWLDRSPRFGAVWGYQRRSDGGMGPGGGNGCLLRLGALRGSNVGSVMEARAWLLHEGWLEGHTDEVCCDALAEQAAYAPLRAERQSPYRVLMLNRHQWGGGFPGFGGDFTQIAGYRQGLRALGITADLRGPDFSDHSGYDLIHLHHTQYDWAWQAADTCLGGQPVVVSTITHGRPPIHKLEAVVSRAKHLICYSRLEAAYYAGLFPHMAERISVVPMGVDPALFSPNGKVEPEAAVLMCGKINDYKNQLGVLEACKRLDLPVRFAGFNEDAIHDPYTDEFARAVAAYPKAEMLGFLRGEALWEEYRRAHVHVNASQFEPFGQVTLDALALGCNVVHSRESWAAEQFGRVGSLCDPADLDNITEAIDVEMKRRRGWANVRPPSYVEAALALKGVYERMLAR